LSGLDTYTDETIASATDTYEGDVTDMNLGVQLRAIYQGEGWRLGMGLRGSSDSSISEITTKTENNDVVTVAGRPVAANNYVDTTTSSLTSVVTNRSVSEIIEIPVGLQIDILKNLPIYFGAAHRVTFTESTTSYEVTERSLASTTRVRGDGSSSTTATQLIDSQEAYNDSGLTSVHNTYYYYGLTWWPKENIQIDIKNIYRWDYWRDYELSFTLHF